jgi:hypothetical protein
MTLKEHIVRFFAAEDTGNEQLRTENLETAVFRLLDGQREVALISHRDGIWVFRYTEEFQADNNVAAITDFPDKSREYRSEVPWSFLLARIPSTKRADVMNYLVARNMDTTDTIQLLREFGRQSISNPYKLIPADSSSQAPVTAA